VQMQLCKGCLLIIWTKENTKAQKHKNTKTPPSIQLQNLTHFLPIVGRGKSFSRKNNQNYSTPLSLLARVNNQSSLQG